MNAHDYPPFREFIIGILERAATKLAEAGEPVTAQTLSHLIIEQLAKPEMKSLLAQAIEPLVQDWLDGQHEN